MFAIGPFYSESYDPDRALASSVRAYPRAKTHNALYSKGEKFFDYRERLRVVGQKGIRVLLVVGEKVRPSPSSPLQSRAAASFFRLITAPSPPLVPHVAGLDLSARAVQGDQALHRPRRRARARAPRRPARQPLGPPREAGARHGPRADVPGRLMGGPLRAHVGWGGQRREGVVSA